VGRERRGRKKLLWRKNGDQKQPKKGNKKKKKR
jgi:hypothetical protein